jgi:hypothetical protein
VTEGRVGIAHARIIGRILSSLLGEQRERVEAELVDLAERLDVVAFGRAARKLQGRIQPDMLAAAQRRQRFDRRFRATDTEDGGFAFSGLLYGTAAETARTAVQAFRRPDAAGEHRTPEQRGADAFEQLCAVALSSGQAPTRHGVRPQVMVTIAADQLALLEQQPEQAVGEFVGSGQPIAGPELRHLLADSKLVRAVLGADDVPIAVSTTVRTVPAGLWRALLLRDGGCTWPGCDAPASWCDVAHGLVPFADDGRLSLDNAMLLCRRHHRLYDASNLEVRIDGRTVSYPRYEGATDRDDRPTGSDPEATSTDALARDGHVEPGDARGETASTDPGVSDRHVAPTNAGRPSGPEAAGSRSGPPTAGRGRRPTERRHRGTRDRSSQLELEEPGDEGGSLVPP